MNNYRTWIELSKDALFYNIAQLKKAAKGSDLALVLKSNAYGHGAQAIASLLDAHSDISWFCTAGLSEALSLRNQGIKKPLIALSYLDASCEDAVIQDIHCSVYTYEDAQRLSRAAQHVGKQVYVHIKIDTGMSRLGIFYDETVLFIKALQKLPNLVIYGIFTHLCDTSNPDQSFSHLQLKQFDTVLAALKEAHITIPCIHAQSSSGLCIVPQQPYTLVRAGASAYGIWKSPEHRKLLLQQCTELDLKPVMTWKTRIIQLKKVPEGSYVGYDRTYRTSRPTIIALAPIGYWEGYPRSLSNKGIGLINNMPAAILGIVSMNLTAFDVTDIPNVQTGNTIILLGNTSPITAQECAQRAGIITNEMVTHINPEIPRIII